MNQIIPTSCYTGLVLALHPNSRGFGWVLFEAPSRPVAWALVRPRRKRRDRLIVSVEQILDRYEPRALVLEESEGQSVRRAERIARFYRETLAAARKRGLETVVFDREAIQMAFAKFGASTRSEIADVIAKHIPDFAHRLPRRRRLGDGEDARQSLFDAAALVLTYFTYRGDAEE